MTGFGRYILLFNFFSFFKGGVVCLWKRFLEHMQNKYSKDGYLKLWIPNSPNAKKLNELRALIEQPVELRKAFDKIFAEEVQEAGENSNS